MHTDNKETQTRKQTKVSESDAKKLRQRAKQFQRKLQQMQAKFNESPDNVYYIVSAKFINQWTDFCQSSELTRFKPHPMNYDLYQNNDLKKGLSEKADFQLVNQQIYEMFSSFQQQSNRNRRQAVMIGREKRVPIYLPSFKYVTIPYQTLKAIDFKRKEKQELLKLKEIKISEESTLNDLVSYVKRIQSDLKNQECRVWIPNKGMNIDKLFDLIRNQLKPCSVASYKVQGVGKRVEDLDAKIAQLTLEQDAYFIIEMKQDNQRFIFLRDGEGRCEGCNQFGKLDFPCGCNKVKYCSEKCLQKDKSYHIRVCSFAEEMQLNKKVVMTKSEKNRNGLVGLNNLGNTCFMNSCLQCLSNTMPLTNYFLNQYFEDEINKTNPIGTKGKLVKNYAKFVKGLWCDEDSTYAPYSVKNAVSDINPMFSGYAQHDSQQFFSFLVDGLHEDLNRIEQKPYVESIEQGNKSEQVLAKQSWVAHLKRNQSIITDIMTGQYRSIVTCPDCAHKSTTFDPFITVTLPIPQETQTVSEFFMIHSHMQKKNKRAWFKYSKRDPQQWNRKACDAVGADPAKCCLYVVSLKQNVYRVGRQSMAQIAHKIQNESKNMFLMQFNEQQLSIPKQLSIQMTMRLSKQTSHSNQQLFFKFPMIFDQRNITGINVYKKYLRFLYGQAYNESKSQKTFGWGGKSYEEYEKQMLKARPFKLILRVGKKIERVYHRIELQYRKEIQIEDDNNIMEILQKELSKVSDCQLDARFQRGRTNDFSFDRIKDFDTVGREPKANKSESQVSLIQCLQSFETPEVLQAGNEWYCPKCKQHKLAKKQLSIYRAPKVLILHLKRFKQKGAFKKQKNQCLVNFPQELNLKDYLINQKPIEAYKEEITEPIYIPSKSEKLPFINFNTKSPPVYELYAISNHYGGLGGGHYTAHAKNNGEWYSFDDSSVDPAGKKNVISQSAYLLFYERKQ